MIGISIYYGYIVGLYLVYLVRNKSFPEFLHYITVTIVVGTCSGIMIYGFIVDSFNDFYGFSITYLVIDFLLVVYGGFRLMRDFTDRF